MPKLKNKYIVANAKEIRDIYVDFIPQCKPFIRFLKENGCYKKFIKKLCNKNLCKWMASNDTVITITETSILRDIIYLTFDLYKSEFLDLDKKWVGKVIDMSNENFSLLDDEINRFLNIAVKKGVKLN